MAFKKPLKQKLEIRTSIQINLVKITIFTLYDEEFYADSDSAKFKIIKIFITSFLSFC